jgi:hypothetical protein
VITALVCGAYLLQLGLGGLVGIVIVEVFQALQEMFRSWDEVTGLTVPDLGKIPQVVLSPSVAGCREDALGDGTDLSLDPGILVMRFRYDSVDLAL